LKEIDLSPHERAFHRVVDAIAAAEAAGVIVEVERQPLTPLAMRNHAAVITAYPKRTGEPKTDRDFYFEHGPGGTLHISRD
jgi:hypothetical protein